MRPMLSLVIPIYNAEAIVRASYAALKQGLDKTGCDYEIIFRDDASSDKSKRIIEDIAASDSKVKAYFHFPNQGLGFTLRQLFKEACGDVIIYSDIDLPFGTECLARLLKELSDVDVVLASRYGSVRSKIPLLRNISSRAYYLLCKILFHIPVKDLGSGLVLFKRMVFEEINLSACGFDIHIEIFNYLKYKGFRVKEIPEKYIHTGHTTFSILTHGPHIVSDTIRRRFT